MEDVNDAVRVVNPSITPVIILGNRLAKIRTSILVKRNSLLLQGPIHGVQGVIRSIKVDNIFLSFRQWRWVWPAATEIG